MFPASPGVGGAHKLAIELQTREGRRGLKVCSHVSGSGS